MSGAMPPLPQYALMAWCLVKAQGQLYLLPLPTELISAINFEKKILSPEKNNPYYPPLPQFHQTAASE
jgi:hypothetical protein